MYHDVAPRDQMDAVGFPGPLARRYKLDWPRFEAHLDALAATGRGVGLVGASGDLPALALTFDDGGSSAIAIAEALERRGWRGHFFVVSSLVGKPGFIDSAGIGELVHRGHVIGSHSHGHPAYMDKLSRPEIDVEWGRSRELLGELLGAEPIHAAIPGGRISSVVVDSAAQAGYRVLMTSAPVVGVTAAGPLRLVGRFAIWSSTPARTAAAYATRSRRAQARLLVEYKAKRALKSLSPGAYEALRRLRAH
jgi:peptidoglycan/xylan/chitin deacetylase (PgdA/CDA1 family)